MPDDVWQFSKSSALVVGTPTLLFSFLIVNYSKCIVATANRIVPGVSLLYSLEQDLTRYRLRAYGESSAVFHRHKRYHHGTGTCFEVLQCRLRCVYGAQCTQDRNDTSRAVSVIVDHLLVHLLEQFQFLSGCIAGTPTRAQPNKLV